VVSQEITRFKRELKEAFEQESRRDLNRSSGEQEKVLFYLLIS
jgi:hypothetical protein